MFDIAVEAAFSGDGQSEPPPPEPTEVLPDTLDSSLVAYGLSDAQPELMRCEGETPIQVLVTVRPSGDIAHFEVAGPPAVQQCVSNAMLGVEFPRTTRGARFRYVIPPVLRPPGG